MSSRRFIVAAAIAPALVFAACAGVRQTARSLLTDSELECALSNPSMESKEVALFCAIDAVLAPTLDQILAAKRAGAKLAGKVRCGGAP